jgi:hypothetical protein
MPSEGHADGIWRCVASYRKTVYLGYYGTIPTTIGLLTALEEL